MQIIRNHLPATNGPFSRDDLDALGDIQVVPEAGDFDGVVDVVPNPNYWRNPGLDLWTRGTSAVSLTHQARTERADHWFARPDYGVVGSGGAGTFAQYEQAADSANQDFLYVAKLSGAAFLAALDFGQEIPARVAAALYPKVTLTIEVENNSGASITPTVRVDTCNTFESFGSVTNRIAQAVPSALANNTRVKWTVHLDLSGFGSSLRNGALIYVRFAGLTATTKSVKVYAAKLEIGETQTDRVVERDVEFIPDAASGATEPRQYFENPNFARWLAEEAECPEDKDTYCAPGFFALSSDGSTMVYNRTAFSPDDDSVFSAQLVGDTLVTGTVDFGQNVPRPVAGEARHDLVFSCAIYNGTGSAVTPTLRVDSANDSNSFDAVTNRLSEALDPCADSAWTTVSFTFDGAGLTDFEKGARIYLRFAAGTLNSVAKSLRFTRMRLERGTSPTTFLPAPELTPPAAIGAVARGLKVKWTDATHLAVSFDEIVLTDRGGRNLRLSANSYPGVHLGTSGAGGIDYVQPATGNTWHYLWVASTGEASAVFISKSATEPTLATGYLWKARIGAFATTGVPGIPELAIFGIAGNRCFMPGFVALNNITCNFAATYQELNISTLVPPEAVTVFGTAGIHTNDECRMVIAGSDGAADMTAGLAPVYILGTNSAGAVLQGFRVSAPFEVPISVAQRLYWASLVKGTTQYRIVISGFTLP